MAEIANIIWLSRDFPLSECMEVVSRVQQLKFVFPTFGEVKPVHQEDMWRFAAGIETESPQAMRHEMAEGLQWIARPAAHISSLKKPGTP